MYALSFCALPCAAPNTLALEGSRALSRSIPDHPRQESGYTVIAYNRMWFVVCLFAVVIGCIVVLVVCDVVFVRCLFICLFVLSMCFVVLVVSVPYFWQITTCVCENNTPSLRGLVVQRSGRNLSRRAFKSGVESLCIINTSITNQY